MAIKRMIFGLLLVALTSSLAGQIQQGTLLLGGTATINSTFRDGSDGFTFGLFPQAGVFVSDRIAVGGEVQFAIVSIGDFSAVSYGLGPYLRYYFLQPTDNTYLYGIGQISILGEGGDLESQAGFSTLIGPGIDIFLNPSVALEGLFGILYTKMGDNVGFTNVGIHFGVQVFLAR